MRSAFAAPSIQSDANRTSSYPNTTDTWQQAIQKYTNTLSPAQQKKFKAPATVDECLKILADNCSRKRAFTRILEFFRPLIDPLKRFEGAIDVVVQTSSGIASPIWGPLRIAITVASDHFETLERLAFIVDKVVGSIQQYQDFEALFASHDGVRNAIGALYCDLIYFCTRLVRFSRKRFSYPFVSFGREFSSVSKSIDLHREEVERAANVAHMKEAKEAREMYLTEKHGQMQHQLRTWLSPSTVEDDLQKHHDECMAGSLDWVVRSTEFDKWVNTSDGSSLEIVGRPGSGKSTLAAFLVKFLSNTTSPVLYFFCNANDGEKRQTICVLRTLIAQLLKIDPILAKNLLPLFQENGRMFADSLRAVQDAFADMMSKRQDLALYIVIDAVDECESAWNRGNLIEILTTCTQNTKVKFVMTRRDISLISNWGTISWSATHKLTVDPGNAAPYIRDYLKLRVQSMAQIANTDLQIEIVDQISQSSDGLWLYARLMADEIERSPSEERIRQRLMELPSGLSSVYSQILRSCEARMTADQREFAKYLYIWLDVSDYMPEFFANNFDSLPYHVLELVFQFVNGGTKVFDAASLARDLGAPLIEVHKIDVTNDPTYEIEFIPRSAYQYLAACSRPSSDDHFRASSVLEVSEVPEVLMPQRLKQLYRGATAVWYFTECRESLNHLEELKNPSDTGAFFWSSSVDAYFEFVYGLWNAFKITHDDLFRNYSKEEKTEQGRLMQRMATFLQSGEALRWFEMDTIINYSGNYRQLLGSVLEASKAPLPLGELSEQAQNFCVQRQNFFRQWAYVIQETTPWFTEWKIYPRIPKPDGFDKNSTALAMLSIARRASDEFFDVRPCFDEDNHEHRHFNSNGLTICTYCSQKIHGYKRDKHVDFGCKAFNKEDRERLRRRRWGGD